MQRETDTVFQITSKYKIIINRCILNFIEKKSPELTQNVEPQKSSIWKVWTRQHSQDEGVLGRINGTEPLQGRRTKLLTGK